MTYYTPNKIEDIDKMKPIINHRKDIKKLQLNKKINKQTLNYNLTEANTAITDLRKKQTEVIKPGQEENTKQKHNQTEAIE